MESLIIYKSSIVCDAVSDVSAIKINELISLAKKEVVSLTFYNEYCRIVAKHTRKVKVPKKALTSEGLIIWIEEKIKKAWQE